MPYCSNCGKSVNERDLYCANCGNRQPVPVVVPADPFSRVSPRVASVLCYIPMMGWIAAVVILASQRFRHHVVVRFHAFQGLYLFAAWLFVQWAVRPMFLAIPDPAIRVDKLLRALILALWIFMIFKANQGEAYELPIIGELAQRSAAERM